MGDHGGGGRRRSVHRARKLGSRDARGAVVRRRVRPPSSAEPPRGDGFEYVVASDHVGASMLRDELAALRAVAAEGGVAAALVVVCDERPERVSEDGEPVLVSAVLDVARGPRLATLLQEQRIPEAGVAVTLLAPVVEVLAIVHRAGFVHGRIEPEAIRVDASGRPELRIRGGERRSRAAPHHDWADFSKILDVVCSGSGSSAPAGVLRTLDILCAPATGPDARTRAASALVEDLHDWATPVPLGRGSASPHAPGAVDAGARSVSETRSRVAAPSSVRRRSVLAAAVAIGCTAAALWVAGAGAASPPADADVTPTTERPHSPEPSSRAPDESGGSSEEGESGESSESSESGESGESGEQSAQTPPESLVVGAERLLLERAACALRGDAATLVRLYERGAAALEADLAELGSGLPLRVGAPVAGSVREANGAPEHGAPDDGASGDGDAGAVRAVEFLAERPDAEPHPASAVLVHGEAGWVLRSVAG